MTPRERLLTVLAGKIPDCVPATPDLSNMVPARLTGKKFWDIYLYDDPPIWLAHINCVKHFGFDGFVDGMVRVYFEDMDPGRFETNEYIVKREEGKIYTRFGKEANGKVFWNNEVRIYFPDNVPVYVPLEKAGFRGDPVYYEKVEKRNRFPSGEAMLKLAKREMGDQGLIGVTCGISNLISSEDQVYDFYDDPEAFDEKRDRLLDYYEKRFERLKSLETKPDFICTGASGTLVFQTVETFRRLGLPIVKKVTKLCRDNGFFSHIHSCGPSKELIKICAEETDLTVIDPLELPPMGDCILSEIKQKYGDRLVIKGNLHTTNTMLLGSADYVAEMSRKAIDDGARGGKFILSTGDQCGRDTPDENIYAMIETARTYGSYRPDGTVVGNM